MKKIMIALVLLIMVFGGIAYFHNRNTNQEVNYDHVLIAEETNPYYQIGFADYVFIGSVNKEVDRTFSDYGTARTIYEIEVTENSKGNLQKTIEVSYPGGYERNGSLTLHQGDFIADEGLLEIGESCIFEGNGQLDGTMLLQDLYTDVPDTEENKVKYLDYIANQEEVERKRMKSKYETE